MLPVINPAKLRYVNFQRSKRGNRFGQSRKRMVSFDPSVKILQRMFQFLLRYRQEIGGRFDNVAGMLAHGFTL